LNNLSFDGGFHYITEEMGGRPILQLLGGVIAWLFVPLGFGHWEAAVATILGLVAKEEVVAVFGSLGLGSAENAAVTIFGGVGVVSMLSGMSFMIFNLLCAPCFAAMGAIKREMNDPRWTAGALGYMTGFAYAVSLIVYQIGLLFTGSFSVWTVAAFAVLAALGYLIFRKNPNEVAGE
jgi:ferrous iron transport protein B